MRPAIPATSEPARAGQHWNAARYALHARFVSDLGDAVVALLDPRRGERILDLGCGDGASSEKIARQGAMVVGIDASESMIAAARHRGIDAHRMDARTLAFDGDFDAVFSNAAMHWMRDLDAVAAGVSRALKPGGRFVGELGGEGNIDTVAAALRRVLGRRGVDVEAIWPWIFPPAASFGAVLERHGFVIRYLSLITRPTRLPGGIEPWLEVFAASFLDPFEEGDRSAVIEEISRELAAKLRLEDGGWWVDYKRLRFYAARN